MSLARAWYQGGVHSDVVIRFGLDTSCVFKCHKLLLRDVLLKHLSCDISKADFFDEMIIPDLTKEQFENYIRDLYGLDEETTEEEEESSQILPIDPKNIKGESIDPVSPSQHTQSPEKSTETDNTEEMEDVKNIIITPNGERKEEHEDRMAVDPLEIQTLMMMSSSACAVTSDAEALLSIKGTTKLRYLKAWTDFKVFSGRDIEDDKNDDGITSDDDSKDVEKRRRVISAPSEDELVRYFIHLRNNVKLAASSIWTTYSMINTVVKNKYGQRLQQFPKLTLLLKHFSVEVTPNATRKEAAVFEFDDLVQFIAGPQISTPYWVVRKVVMIVAYFGGLRHTETMDLKLEKLTIDHEGVWITHGRPKLRGQSKGETTFLVPDTGDRHAVNFAAVVRNYVTAIKDTLHVTQGRLFYTGKQFHFVATPMGKNLISSVPKQMAQYLKKENAADFTFHSLRQLSASATQ